MNRLNRSVAPVSFLLLMAVSTAALWAQEPPTIALTGGAGVAAGIGLVREQVVAGSAGFDSDFNAGEFFSRTDTRPQTAAVSGISVAFELRQPLGRATMIYDISAAVHHFPTGYWDPTGLSILPGQTGLEVLVDPDWWFGPVFAARVGRITLSDPTSLTLSQLADGLSLRLRWPMLYTAVEVGYTGLLDKFANPMRVSESDWAAIADDSVYFASPRGVGVLRIEYAGPGSQEVGLFGIGQLDFTELFAAVNTWHAGAVIRGPAIGPVRHETSLTVGGKWPGSTVGMLASTVVTASFPSSPAASVSATLQFSSGDGQTLDQYPVLTFAPVGTIVASPLSGIAILGVAGRVAMALSALPGSVDAELRVDTFVRAGEASSGFTGAYFGTEALLHVDYRPIADLELDATFGAHFSPVPRIYPFFGLGLEVEW